MKQIKLIPVFHRGANRLLTKFDKDSALQKIVKKIPGALWTKTFTSWYVDNNPENLKLLFDLFKDVATNDATAVFSGNNDGKRFLIQFVFDYFVYRSYNEVVIK